MDSDINVNDIFDMVFALSEEIKKVKCISNEITDYFESGCDTKEDLKYLLCCFERNKILFDILNDYIYKISNQISDVLQYEKKFIDKYK